VVAAEGNRGQHVLPVARNDDADRDLAIVGTVRGIKSSATGIEANFSSKMAAQGGLEGGDIEVYGAGGRRCGIGRHGVQNIFEDAGVARKG
jgi:hypothetical protein